KGYATHLVGPGSFTPGTPRIIALDPLATVRVRLEGEPANPDFAFRAGSDLEALHGSAVWENATGFRVAQVRPGRVTVVASRPGSSSASSRSSSSPGRA